MLFFWPAQFVKTLETRCWYRPTLLVTTFYYGKSLIISLPVRAKPNQEMRSTFFLCQKKDKMADGHPWRLCVYHSPFKGADFCEERTGNFRASGKQIWKSVWNEHKLLRGVIRPISTPNCYSGQKNEAPKAPDFERFIISSRAKRVYRAWC